MLPFLLGSGEATPGFHQGCKDGSRRGSDVFNFNVQPRKKPSKPKQTVFMISTSQHSIIPLPVSDKHSQLLPRKHLRDGDTAPEPPAAALGSEGQRSPPPSRVPELTLPSHGSRECREGRAVLSPQINLVPLFLRVSMLKRLSRFRLGFEFEIFCGFLGREQT